MPCGICGIINFKGLTWGDLQYFTEVLLDSEDRGHHATGVAAQDLSYAKSGVPAKKFVETNEFRKILKNAIGQKWIIGHTRWATQGDPKENRNNHPVTTLPGKFLMIHNGVVGSTKFEIIENKTDTYVVARAIRKEWKDGDLFTSVQNAYKLFYGAAAISVITHKEIVLAKRWNPIILAYLKNDAIAFASETRFLTQENNIPASTEEMGENKIIGFNSAGVRKDGEVEFVQRPWPQYDEEEEVVAEPTEEVKGEELWEQPRQEYDDEAWSWQGAFNWGQRNLSFWDRHKQIQERERRIREQQRKKKGKGRGKGWFKDYERHRRARLLGYADYI